MLVKNKLQISVICCVLAFGTVLLYWPTFNFDFVNYDDPDYLLNNFHVRQGLTWEGMRWAFQAGYADNWHPVTWISHMLDFQLYGLRPGAHHATNVLLHSLNSVLLFFVLRRMTGTVWRSAAVAALFAWHPLHVESVAWVSERKDVLSTMFMLLMLWAYLRYADGLKEFNSEPQMKGSITKKGNARSNSAFSSGFQNKGRCGGFYTLTIVLFILGLMAKPMLVTAPFVLLLLDWWPLGRIRWKKGSVSQRDRYRLVEKIPFFVLSGLSCSLTIYAQRGAMRSVSAESIPWRLGNSLVGYVQYLAKIFCPRNLAVFYPLNKNSPLWEPAISAFILVAITIVAVQFRKSRPYLMMGWLWFLGTLVPVIGLVQVGGQAIADRYTYIPSIGIFLAIIWAVCDLPLGGPFRQATLAALASVVLAACLLLTEKQIGYWKNSETLFLHAIKATDDNDLAYANLGVAYTDAHQYDKALAACKESIRINPNYTAGKIALGKLLFLQQKPADAAAELRSALELAPGNPSALYGLGRALLAENLPEEAAAQFAGLLHSDPGNPVFLYYLGKSLAAQNKLDEASERFHEALRQNPSYFEAHLALAATLQQQHKTAEAISEYRAALSLRPDDAESLISLAKLLSDESNPDFRDPSEAVSVAQRANALRNNSDAAALAALAAAYFEFGNLDPAASAAQKALALAKTQNNKAISAEALELLGRVSISQNLPLQAASQFTESLQFDPTNAATHFWLGLALSQQHKTRDAAPEFSQALSLRPDYPDALGDLAHILACDTDPALRDGTRAVELAERACKLTANKQPQLLITLAAAYAEAGRFDDAVAAATQVHDTAVAAGDSPLAAASLQLIELFRSHRPYHEN